MTTLNTNLAASGGGAADGIADSIIVNGTAGDDTIDVVADEGDVVVLGLMPTVRVGHADPTVDGLIVNGFEGNDAIAPTPDAEAMIVLTVAP